jgi:pimeloyl-ACP methyl ester carboxylesterase
MTTRHVLVLHGLWMHAPAMRWFATRLRARGFDASALGYYSLVQGTDAGVARIVAALRPDTAIVAHSLGGLLAIRAAQAYGPERIGRIVCLGTPVAGSAAAGSVMARVPAGRQLLHRHGELLCAGCGAIPAGLEVGNIAGCVPRGLGGLVGRFSDAHDGTVRVAETRMEGLADHVVVRASHSGLIFSDAAVRQAVAFLEDGRFVHPP